MLLSDPSVVEYINQRFVPCWESVRPVPKVTIDFGDGRTLRRTLQGNTVLYVCLPDGRVIDALPGVYTPASFLAETRKTLAKLEEMDRQPTGPISARLAEWHRTQVTEAIRSERLRITMSKMVVESPLLDALGIRRGLPNPPNRPEPPLQDVRASFAAVSAKIEDMSHRASTADQIRAAYARPGARQPTPEEIGRRAVEMDSFNNVRLARPTVHLLFASFDRLPVPRACRDTIYKQVLHVPIDDPNLGLAAAIVPGTPPAR